MATMSEQLHAAMKNRGISIRELSELSGVPEETLKKIKANDFDGNVSILAQISDALNITFQIGNTSI